MKFTEKQKRAIFAKDKDILISAAAGSGKTTVLAERVLHLIEEGADIRRMLICTYTRAAAGELRQRIYSILAAAAEETGDARLRSQADMTACAHIGTIHSFCTEVIRDNFIRAGLKINWRTGTGPLNEKLMDIAAEEAISSLYEEDNEDMLWLSARYGKRNDKTVKENILRLYKLSRSMPGGLHSLLKTEKDYLELINKSEKSFVRSNLILMLSYAEQCVNIAENCPEFTKETENAHKILSHCKFLLSTLENEGTNALYDVLDKGFIPRLSRITGAEYEKKAYTNCKNKIKDTIDSLTGFFSGSEKTREEEAEYLARLSSAMNTLLVRFEKQYSLEKSERNLLDYDDLIHTAYSLLLEDDIAQNYKDSIDYIFIDEYQDTNEIQDALIERIAKENTRFIVGDVKQSIYSFRLADPQVFIKKSEKIAEEGEVVYMNDNFRSAPAVIDEINGIMRSLMTKDLGGVEYTGGEELIAGRNTNGGVRLLCALSDDSPIKAEAEMIAGEVEELLKEGYKREEIAILLRKKNDAAKIIDALSRRDIPSFFDGAATTPPEIDLFVAYLHLLDSENDDTAMIAAMRAPAAAFDEEELAEIRTATPEGSFARAVREYDGEDDLKEKISEFLSSIDSLRLLCESMPTEEFLPILKSYTQFDKLLPAMPDGEARYSAFSRFFDSLLSLCKENDDLYSLICRLEEIKEQSKNGSYAQTSEAETLSKNSVNIMTVHKSKGLQFKAVILARLDGGFNMTDSQERVLFSGQWGAVSDIYDIETMRRFATRSSALIKNEIRANTRSEELRVLYVAMTRAEERLIMTFSSKKEDFKFTPPLTAKCYADWLLFAADNKVEFRINTETSSSEKSLPELEEILSLAEKTEAAKIITPVFEDIPVKLGVSSLLSAYETEESSSPLEPQLSEEPIAAHRKNSGTDFGTLIHAFLQHYDFSSRPDVRKSCDTMLEKQLIDDAEKEQILSFEDELEVFIHSPLADRISRADEVLRELPFSIGVSSKELGYENEDTVVIQGIMDLVIKEGNDYTIIDYKTNLSTDFSRLRAHYAPQLGFYRRALEECRHANVKECLLCFLRSKKIVRV